METQQTAFRLEIDLIERVDNYAARTSDSLGVTITRADAVRLLLKRALDDIERPRRGKGAKR